MTTCAKCAVPLSGAYCAGEMPWTCDNADACALRAELRDLRAAVLAVADRMRSAGLGVSSSDGVLRERWDRALREACGEVKR